jgi:hypothetical protein
MNRRSALKYMSLGAGTLIIPPAAGCRSGAGKSATLALASWSGPPPEEQDVRMRALSYAVLAPNAHNTQPWLLGLSTDTVDLYVDPKRLLPETAPPYRQTHISQGTFIELLVIAFAEHGVATEVRYFPDGEYGNDTVKDLPVARVRLVAGSVAKDPLFAAITSRTSTKRIYEPGRELSAPDGKALSAAPTGEGVSVQIVDEAGARSRLATICADAMAVEVKAVPRNAETAHWFRFSEDEIEEKRDGFSVQQTGAGALKRWVAETFVLDRAGASDPNGSFAKGAVDQAHDQARSAAAFGALASDENTRRAQIVAGRAYARVALTATS